MIESIRHKGLKRFYQDDDRSRLPPDMVECIAVVLAALDAAPTIEAVARPSFRLHRLKGICEADGPHRQGQLAHCVPFQGRKGFGRRFGGLSLKGRQCR